MCKKAVSSIIILKTAHGFNHFCRLFMSLFKPLFKQRPYDWHRNMVSMYARIRGAIPLASFSTTGSLI